MTHDRPAYLRVLATFARNSLVRDMTFRGNFIIEMVTSLVWALMNVGFYLLVFQYTPRIGTLGGGADAGWTQWQFFAFLATTAMINSLVQAFFMPNTSELSERIRTGNLDFALLKPIDTQFLVSLEKIEWSSLSNFFFGTLLLAFSLWKLDFLPSLVQLILYPFYILCGVAILYSLMITLGSLSVWLGRNQNLYDFWFYITNFSRYPMEIYQGPLGRPLRLAFTFVIPILVVVNVPARIIARPLSAQSWPLALFALVATAACLWLSRRVFLWGIDSYRSASS